MTQSTTQSNTSCGQQDKKQPSCIVVLKCFSENILQSQAAPGPSQTLSKMNISCLPFKDDTNQYTSESKPYPLDEPIAQTTTKSNTQPFIQTIPRCRQSTFQAIDQSTSPSKDHSNQKYTLFLLAVKQTIKYRLEASYSRGDILRLW